MVTDTVPEFLLNDEDEEEDDIDINVDPCALSPTGEPLWPAMSAADNDNLPTVDDILSAFPGTLQYQRYYDGVS